ncbi:hypothetical protein chiPu_0018211 [Chiloscyllium punctatum]|uniref:Major facilitator superfamily (MFS) profile domain-containing protein n=1 Tax=Chiloscyllium punctatum TaxID=137246 RepID=A0A401RLV2_CHIPU|nr:hypothetical protein [Chiloscyllium punctatum]
MKREWEVIGVERFQNRWLYLAVFTATLGNLSFGYALVYTSPVIPELQQSPDPLLRLDDYKASFFESIFTLGVVFGGLTTMLLNDLLGRKLTIMLSNVPSVLGFAIMGSAQAVWMLDLGRALTGIAGGMLSGTVPVSRFSCSELSQRHIYKPMLIAVFMRIFQQFSGITVFLVNMQIIFDSTAVILAGCQDAVLVGAIRFLSVSVAAWLMDKAGRRRLLFVSGVIMSISTLSLGVYVKLDEFKYNHTSINASFENMAHLTAQHLLQHKTTNWLTIIPLISVMVFIFGYALGWGPITWLMMSEILPLKVRGFASGLCVVVSWVTAFILTEFFLQVKHTFGLAVPFLFFCAVSILGIIFTAFCIPETRKRTLEQIQDMFQNPKAPRVVENN